MSVLYSSLDRLMRDLSDCSQSNGPSTTNRTSCSLPFTDIKLDFSLEAGRIVLHPLAGSSVKPTRKTYKIKLMATQAAAGLLFRVNSILVQVFGVETA